MRAGWLWSRVPFIRADYFAIGAIRTNSAAASTFIQSSRMRSRLMMRPTMTLRKAFLAMALSFHSPGARSPCHGQTRIQLT